MGRPSTNPRRGRSGWTAALVLWSAALAVGCGADDGDASATPPEPTIASSTTDHGGERTEGPSSSVAAARAQSDGAGDDETATAADGEEAAGSPAPSDDGPTTTEGPEPDPDDVLTPVGPEDSGDDVAALQTRLDELGFSPGPADGDYGRRTETAVRVFQELNELRPTGEADAPTMRALALYRYDGLRLAAGDEGDEVEELQRRLADGPLDPGPIDGVYGQATVAAVWALEKLAEVPIDGDWGPADELAWRKLTEGEVGTPERDNEQRWVEVDLSKQLMKVYDPGRQVPVLVSHASSGSGIPWENEEHSGNSITPTGDFHINRRISGWRESSLDIGRLYNPLYFNGGIAFHGATSVPLYPASHGCIRLPMHIAEYLPDELPNGTPVHVMA